MRQFSENASRHRDLHYDQYCMLILLYLFNPIVTSLRGLQQASELEKVRKRLGCGRTALGSFSEAATVFDPERLKEIIDELGAHPIRLIRVATSPHTSRGKYRGGSTGPGSDGILRIATNLLDAR